MDTVEELNDTYYFNGLSNLTAYELLFWILIDETEKQLGVEDIMAVMALILGDNAIDVPGKPANATPGTSHASLFFRKHISYKFKSRVLPTLTRRSFSMRGLQIFWVNHLGTFIGRTIPVVGWVILASDVVAISYRTVQKYNVIARYEDKIW